MRGHKVCRDVALAPASEPPTCGHPPHEENKASLVEATACRVFLPKAERVIPIIHLLGKGGEGMKWSGIAAWFKHTRPMMLVSQEGTRVDGGPVWGLGPGWVGEKEAGGLMPCFQGTP